MQLLVEDLPVSQKRPNILRLPSAELSGLGPNGSMNGRRLLLQAAQNLGQANFGMLPHGPRKRWATVKACARELGEELPAREIAAGKHAVQSHDGGGGVLLAFGNNPQGLKQMICSAINALLNAADGGDRVAVKWDTLQRDIQWKYQRRMKGGRSAQSLKFLFFFQSLSFGREIITRC